jgi:hypothetical protein
MMGRLVVKVGLLAVWLLSTGCSTYAAARYSGSADNVTALRTHRGQVINVGSFKAPEENAELMCRAVGPIKTPDGEPFSAYVRKALISELKFAEVYSAEAPVTLSGTLEHIDFSSTSGTWDMRLTVKSSNGRSLTVNKQYEFTSSFIAETACNQAAQALMPAVQDLINKVVTHKKFAGLLVADGSQPVAEEPEPPAEKTFMTDCPQQPDESARERAIRCKALAKEKGGGNS